MYSSNLQLEKLFTNLEHIILIRREFTSALEQFGFELAFTDNIQKLLIHTNENWMNNLTLHLIRTDI
jgi:hypothetical protein